MEPILNAPSCDRCHRRGDTPVHRFFNGWQRGMKSAAAAVGLGDNRGERGGRPANSPSNTYSNSSSIGRE